MSRIESFTIGKGKTTKPNANAEEWSKRHLEFTVRLPENYTEKDLQQAIIKAEQTIDGFLGQVDVSSVPDLDIAEINELPWRIFAKGSQPGSAKPNTPGWIFRNGQTPGTHDLAEAIEKAGGSLDLGQWTFKFSGKDNSFINRTKKKES